MSQQREPKPCGAYIEGAVVAVTDEEIPTSRGPFRVRNVIVRETSGQYPSTLVARFSGKSLDKALDSGVNVGDSVRVEGYVKSRPSKDGSRWFTEFAGTWLKVLGKNTQVGTTLDGPGPASPPTGDDDIPF